MREIPLTQGKTALVDDADYDDVARFKWMAHKGRGKTWYARRAVHVSERERLNGRRWISMHRYLLSHVPTKSTEIDHKNRDGLDNQRTNLRVGNRSLNQVNSGPSSRNKLGLKGVSQNRQGRPYAQIGHGATRLFLGRFGTPEEAARAYDLKARELYGEFAYLNFPESVTQ
jgi:hypothetical protein